jgi:hypothetical protein
MPPETTTAEFMRLLSRKAATTKVTELLVKLHDNRTVVEELTITLNASGTEEIHIVVRNAVLGDLTNDAVDANTGTGATSNTLPLGRSEP